MLTTRPGNLQDAVTETDDCSRADRCAPSVADRIAVFFKSDDVRCFARFCTVGLSGVVVDLSSYSLLRLVELPVPAATALAIWVAMSWNFTHNRRWTFSDRNAGSVVAQYVRFCLSCLTGALLNGSTRVALWTFVTWFTHHELLAAGFGVAAGTFFNFSMCRLLVFTQPADNSSPDGSDGDALPTAPATCTHQNPAWLVGHIPTGLESASGRMLANSAQVPVEDSISVTNS